ncbi:hypothetical protein DYB32_005915 [Aphanomyces invadans]|uniref:Uncharacterized protein n=1 Tax=Aphanomyces invadans TaxID=157072 RepID=A0A418AT64_9STRA|nr:hypothetical protein DYB32_005915 [Aphanomyces invadans]
MTAPVQEVAQRPHAFSLTNAFRCTLLHHAKDESFTPRSSSFNLDIQPKMLLSNSPLVDVLVHSGVGRYLDVMAMQGTFMYSAQPQREVDVTTLNERDLTSSRALKRPQNKQHDVATASFDQYESFTDVLAKHFKLSAALQQVVLYAVLLETSASPVVPLSTPNSLNAIYNFVTSIGKFAPSPYLTPMYGISEVAQSFCRLGAVYNGTYILRTPVAHLNIQDTTDECGGAVKCVGLSTAEGLSFRAKHVVLNASAHGHSLGYTPQSAVLRGIFIVGSSIQPGVDRLVVVIPPGEIAHPNEALSTSAVHVLQMDSAMGVCASGYFLVRRVTPNLN